MAVVYTLRSNEEILSSNSCGGLTSLNYVRSRPVATGPKKENKDDNFNRGKYHHEGIPTP
jgi:hypothetical protein